MNNNEIPENLKRVLMIDQQLRKTIADYYTALKGMKDSKKSVDFLAEHASIMIEMINEFKKDY